VTVKEFSTFKNISRSDSVLSVYHDVSGLLLFMIIDVRNLPTSFYSCPFGFALVAVDALSLFMHVV
jgi:hypothetical protein